MKAVLLSLVILLGVLIFPATAQADELRPAYIELTEQAANNWSLLWKASANSRLGKSGEVIFPDNCKAAKEPERKFSKSNIITRLSLKCDGVIDRKTIGLEGLQYTTTDALVRISYQNGELQTLRLTPDQHQTIISKKDQISNIFSTYTLLGVEHILLGFDHLLFVLALVLLLKSGWLVAKTVTAFTIAHSFTLIGTTLGYLSLPQRPVEAIIALSIIFLAVEIVKTKPGELRLSERFPWIVAFTFGLLHGFGFAGALAEIGLPEGDVPLALLTFNLGVEIGQLLIIAVALIILGLIKHFQKHLLVPAKTFAAYAIGSAATYWFIDRMIA